MKASASALLMALMALIIPVQGHSASWPRLELPPSMRVQVVSDSMVINGLPTQVIEFHSEQYPAEITRWFSDAWAGQIAESKAAGWQVLAHRKKDALITVQITELEEVGSRGFIAVSQAFAAVARKAAVRTDLPMLPGTQQINLIESEDHGKKSSTAVLISEQSSVRNLDFYMQHFRLQGYEPVSRGALSRSDVAGAMILNRGGDSVDVSAVQRDGRTVITIVSVR